MATRGRKPQANAKRKLIVVRFQDVEFNAVQKYAKQLDKPISTLVRDVLLAHMEAEGIPTSIIEDDPNQLKIEAD